MKFCYITSSTGHRALYKCSDGDKWSKDVQREWLYWGVRVARNGFGPLHVGCVVCRRQITGNKLSQVPEKVIYSNITPCDTIPYRITT